MKVWRCPNGCSVSDESKRCKTCDAWMRYDGDHEKEEIERKTEELSMERIPSDVHLPNK